MAVALLYPFAGFLANIGAWTTSGDVARANVDSVRVSLALTFVAMLVVIATGTPFARYVSRCGRRERLVWQALLLLSTLTPPLALGLLLALAFGPGLPLGAALARAGVMTANTPLAFVVTQAYVAFGYYALAAIAAFDAVPRALERQAELLGDPPLRAFIRVTLPLAGVGLAVGVALAWVRALGEFGAVAVTAYHPSGMPVQLWTDLEGFGLPAVMPLLVMFLAAALPLPWLVHVLAQRRNA